MGDAKGQGAQPATTSHPTLSFLSFPLLVCYSNPGTLPTSTHSEPLVV